MNLKKILIIDDDLVIAEIYQRKFSIAGYEAEVADERRNRGPVRL